MFTVYYLICVFYCFYRLIKRYRKNSSPGMIGETPGLDALMVLIMAWVLAPVDVAITWIRMVKEAEEAKIRQNNINVSFKDEPKEEKTLLRDSIY